MNTEEYIKKELLSHVVGDHPSVAIIFEESAKKVLDRYRKHEYFDLMPMIEEAAEDINKITRVVTFLIKGGTIQNFADYADVCYGTARKILNNSPYADRDCSSRPYRYFLIK